MTSEKFGDEKARRLNKGAIELILTVALTIECIIAAAVRAYGRYKIARTAPTVRTAIKITAFVDAESGFRLIETLYRSGLYFGVTESPQSAHLHEPA